MLGVKNNATGNFQLLRSDLNKLADTIQQQIRNGNLSRAAELDANRIRVEMISVDPGLTGYMYDWVFSLELRKPLYELKMGRFGLRYKYEDGEYSSFGPWSELAFLPDKYDYQSKRGYNYK